MARTALVAGRAAGPFLKWAGGKKQLLPQFQRLYPKRIERYIEPFVGSGAVFFDVRQRFDLESAALSDNNDELVNCYQVVRDDVDGLIKLLTEYKENHHACFPEHFYRVRELVPEELTPVARAARLIYLNKTCYNGLYRVNAEGRFNVPVGRYKNPAICDPKLLRAASDVLQGVRLEVREFSGWLRTAREGDFFYIDPPYYPRSKTANFTEYTGGGFGLAEQKRLAQFARKLDAKGCVFMVSNSDTDVINSLYEGFRITKVRARRAINSNHRARGAVNELVIRNY